MVIITFNASHPSLVLPTITLHKAALIFGTEQVLLPESFRGVLFVAIQVNPPGRAAPSLVAGGCFAARAFTEKNLAYFVPV